MPRRKKGKIWPQVRAAIWKKAQELFQQEQAVAMGRDFTGNTATRRELMEGGYFYRAKIIVLRNLWLTRKGLPSLKEQEFMERYGSRCL